MTRAAPAVLLIGLIGLTACGGGPAPELLPAGLGPWRRAAAQEIPPQNPPEPVPSVERITQALYEGPVRLTVRVYQVPGPVIGLDFVQRWQAPPNVDYFYEGAYVAVIEWPRAERPDLGAFTTALRAHLRGL